ncbi:MAG: vanillate monooxygenase [Rhizobium sp.]|nr:MAG: vanillate monooxygenase [Rhizobium sp.]
MAFLRNAWYAAGWETELEGGVFSRTILNEPVVVISAGSAVSAFVDACPHRFAPLSKGRIVEGTIQCRYHGLKFDMAGRCVHNPHGNGACPVSLALKPFPVTISQGIVWIWMGDIVRAADTLPPDYPFLVDPDIRGYLHVSANYQLVVDNLLDLSHVEFLHPFLSPPGSSSQIQFKAIQEGDRVTAYHLMPDQPNTPLFEILLGKDVGRIDGRAHMHWTAPANLMLDTGATLVGQPEGRDAQMPQAHLLTPETELTSHYFWGVSRNSAREDQEISAMLRGGIQSAFENEDEPMVRAFQERMAGLNLFDLSPALLPMDEASVRARRVLQRLIDQERQAA